MTDNYRPKRSVVSDWPAWVKAALVKAWYAGAVFYFIGWGVFLQSSDQLDLTFALGLTLGLVTDLLANRTLVFFETDRQSYRRYIFSYSRRFLSVPVNLVYGIALSFAVAYTYHFLNLAALRITARPPGTIFLGAEPILYGLFYSCYDMLCVLLKNTLKGVFLRSSH